MKINYRIPVERNTSLHHYMSRHALFDYRRSSAIRKKTKQRYDKHASAVARHIHWLIRRLFKKEGISWNKWHFQVEPCRSLDVQTSNCDFYIQKGHK